MATQEYAGRITPDHVRAALRLEGFDAAGAQAVMAPYPRTRLKQYDGIPPRQAGVLALVYPDAEHLYIVLTRRTDHLRGHSGQISFPGGRQDPEDADLRHTALRETCEELGLCEVVPEMVGSLESVYIPPSHYNVYPSVGLLVYTPDFQPNPHEVAEVIPLSLHALLNPALKAEEYHTYENVRVRIPYYNVDGHKVWGATAVMLGELEARLRAVL